MKLLFLANRIPYPPFRGDKLKIYNLGKRLSARHKLYLIAFVEQKSDFHYKAQLLEIFEEVHLIYLPRWKSWFNSGLNLLGKQAFQVAYFKSKAMKRCLAEFMSSHQIDAIHTQHLRMSQYTAHDYLNTPRILDLPDAYSLYWERRKKVKRPWWNQIFDALESKRVIQAEKVVHQFDLNLVCSVEDRDHMLELHKGANIKLLRNGVDLSTFKYQERDYVGAKTLLFTGNMDYAPNVDGVVHFVETMFPEIVEKHPDVQLIVAGQRPVKQIQDLASDRVQITGFVEDISEVYTQADVVIAPLRFGAGTQNKVLEAMAMGVPVVCTDIGFAGLEIESGQGVLHSDTDKAFIQNVFDLLESQALRKQVGQIGLDLAKTKFSWEGISVQLEEYFKEVVGIH